MKSLRRISGLLLIALLFSSFKTDRLKETEAIQGIYRSSSGSDVQEVIKLVLKSDYSFELIDRLNPNNQIEVVGSYTRKGNRIELIQSNSSASFIRIWHLDSRYPCIKGRKGMEFIRICAEGC